MRGLALCALLVLTCLAGAVPASAATYHAYLCRVPYGSSAGKPAPTDNTPYTSNAATTSAVQTCATGGAMSATVAGPATVGAGAAVLFNAPARLTIAGFRLWRSETVGWPGNGGGPFTKATYDTTPVETDCNSGVGRGDAGSPLAATNEVTVSNLSGVKEIRWNAFCGGGPGGSCSGGPAAVYRVHAADVLLSDPAPPAVSNVGGSLLASGGTLSGVGFVSLSATDAGSGVHRGTLLVDGTVVTDRVLDDNGGACADLGVSADSRPSYVNTQPCPPSGPRAPSACATRPSSAIAAPLPPPSCGPSCAPI